MEAFYSIQGEGYNAGNPAYFLRLGGCDVGCVWCDVKESWEASDHPNLDIKQILDQIEENKVKNIVVTGGEPLMYNLDELTSILKSKDKRLWLETSGAHSFSGQWDWVCLSPKKFKKPLTEVYQHANELKIIVYNKSDLDFAVNEAKKVDSDCILILQPEWGKEKEMTPLIVDFVKQNPDWRISLQTHKYLSVP